jgi:Protein of unknown function (DUF642)
VGVIPWPIVRWRRNKDKVFSYHKLNFELDSLDLKCRHWGPNLSTLIMTSSPSTPFRLLLTTAATFAGVCGVHGQNLLQNPSFEDPFVSSGFVSAGTLPGWIVSGPASIISYGYIEGDANWPLPTDGRNQLDLYGNIGVGSIAQSVHLVGGSPYKLSFDLGSLIDPTNPFFQVAAGVNFDLTSGLLSALGGSHYFSTPYNSGFAHEQINFTAPSTGDYLLTVASTGTTYSSVDNFDLSKSTPDGGSTALLAGLALTMGAVMHRATRRSK